MSATLVVYNIPWLYIRQQQEGCMFKLIKNFDPTHLLIPLVVIGCSLIVVFAVHGFRLY